MIRLFKKLFILILLIIISFYFGYKYNSYQKNLQSPVKPPLIINKNLQIPTSAPYKELDKTNWKTYTNNDYGFSFKYPSQFEVEVKKSLQSRTLDSKNEIIRYDFIFTTGKIVNGGTDFSGFAISVEPTNGKTIVQVFGKDSMGEAFDSKYFYPIKQKGGADEAFIANGLIVYRVKNLFYWSTPFQNSRVLPDESDDIGQFSALIFDTIIFK